MKRLQLLFLSINIIVTGYIYGQDATFIKADSSNWVPSSLGKASYNSNIIHLKKDGEQPALLWVKDVFFKNGTIDLDIKGKDEQGNSFVGLAFHAMDSINYDAVYFRPFNFKNPQRHGHSVQYINHPKDVWHFLRKNYPKAYENSIVPAPNPNDWFHVTIVIQYPSVKVYVNNSKTPSLEVDQRSSRTSGNIGLWVGSDEGWFKNVTIKKEDTPSKILIDNGHEQRFWRNIATVKPTDKYYKRMKYLNNEILKTASKVNAKVAYNNDAITPEDLEAVALLFIHVPCKKFTLDETALIQQFIKTGGSLFLVMDEDFWSTLKQTNINNIIKPFDIAFGDKIPDSLPGGYTIKTPINKVPLKISYHGGRIVKGGTPFCYGKQTKDFPFGVYKKIGKGKVIVMGDAMSSLYMNSWEGVDDYQCQEFMQDAFRWLLD
ncbi:hypothetical protein MHTCC0001_19050 [Flavobacteriaceae bacterium MHTCC 0001]